MSTLAFQYALELSGVVRSDLSRYTELRSLIDSEIILAVSALGVGLLMGSLRQSTAQAQAAAASARESEQLYRSLFESVTEAIFVHDPRDGRICDANARASQWFGYPVDELRSLSVGDLSTNTDGFTQAEAMRRIALTAQGQPQLFEWRSRARDGRLFWTEISTRAALVGGAPRVLVSLRDIDERKRAEVERQRLGEQLRQAQKLESLGRLAGGIAHDFNNLLTCVLGNVDLGLVATSPGDPVRENLEEIAQAGRRAAELTSQLLAFSRKQPIAPVSLDVKYVLGSLDRMLRRLLGETFVLATEVAPHTGRIRADPGQVEQMLVNLAVNARDAMPSGGRLEITAANHDTDEAFVAAHPGAHAGQFVRLSVADSGMGMSDEVQRLAFEPFFTTKPPGQGTGLGLAMVLGAMEQNGGFVVLTSRCGEGSRFDLFFPRFLGEAEAVDDRLEIGALPTGSERVLLVEDDAAVRQLSARLLVRLGYQVTACETGAKALALCAQPDAFFALLLTDIILPDLDGRTLAGRLAAKRPWLARALLLWLLRGRDRAWRSPGPGSGLPAQALHRRVAGAQGPRRAGRAVGAGLDVLPLRGRCDLVSPQEKAAQRLGKQRGEHEARAQAESATARPADAAATARGSRSPPCHPRTSRREPPATGPPRATAAAAVGRSTACGRAAGSAVAAARATTARPFRRFARRLRQ